MQKNNKSQGNSINFNIKKQLSCKMPKYIARILMQIKANVCLNLHTSIALSMLE